MSSPTVIVIPYTPNMDQVIVSVQTVGEPQTTQAHGRSWKIRCSSKTCDKVMHVLAHTTLAGGVIACAIGAGLTSHNPGFLITAACLLGIVDVLVCYMAHQAGMCCRR